MGGRQYPHKAKTQPTNKTDSAVRWVWEKSWRWEFVVIGSTLLYGFGVAAMYGDDYFVAAVLYFISAAWITAKSLAWEETRKHPRRFGVSILFLTVWASGFMVSLGWISHRAHAHRGIQMSSSENGGGEYSQQSPNTQPPVAIKEQPFPTSISSSKPLENTNSSPNKKQSHSDTEVGGDTSKFVNNTVIGESAPLSSGKNVEIRNNDFYDTNSAFQNAGKSDKVLMEGNVVHSSPGHKGTVVQNLPSGELNNLTARKNQVVNDNSTPAVGSITQGSGSIVQVGGTGNTATVNNGPPPVSLRATWGPSPDPQSTCTGLTTNVVITPNQAVSPPVHLAFDVDTPVLVLPDISVEGAGVVMSGGSARIGLHPKVTLVTPGITPEGRAVVRVCTAVPITQVSNPHLEER